MSHCINTLIQETRSLVVAQDNQAVLPHRAFKVEDFFPTAAVETFSAIPEEPLTIEAAELRNMSHAALNRLVENQLTAQQCDVYLVWCEERNVYPYDAANIQGFLIGETPTATLDRWRETMKKRRLEAKAQEKATEKAKADAYFENLRAWGESPPDQFWRYDERTGWWTNSEDHELDHHESLDTSDAARDSWNAQHQADAVESDEPTAEEREFAKYWAESDGQTEAEYLAEVRWAMADLSESRSAAAEEPTASQIAETLQVDAEQDAIDLDAIGWATVTGANGCTHPISEDQWMEESAAGLFAEMDNGPLISKKDHHWLTRRHGSDSAFLPIIGYDSTGNLLTNAEWEAAKQGNYYPEPSAEEIAETLKLEADCISESGLPDFFETQIRDLNTFETEDGSREQLQDHPYLRWLSEQFILSEAAFKITGEINCPPVYPGEVDMETVWAAKVALWLPANYHLRLPATEEPTAEMIAEAIAAQAEQDEIDRGEAAWAHEQAEMELWKSLADEDKVIAKYGAYVANEIKKELDGIAYCAWRFGEDFGHISEVWLDNTVSKAQAEEIVGIQAPPQMEEIAAWLRERERMTEPTPEQIREALEAQAEEDAQAESEDWVADTVAKHITPEEAITEAPLDWKAELDALDSQVDREEVSDEDFVARVGNIEHSIASSTLLDAST
jgi:hypothetical protein